MNTLPPSARIVVRLYLEIDHFVKGFSVRTVIVSADLPMEIIGVVYTTMGLGLIWVN